MFVVALALLVGVASTALAAEGDLRVRANGVQLDVPVGWARVAAAEEARTADPRTLLVVGTKGARPIEAGCQVASYAVPADGAVVVVIGWRRASDGTSLLPLSALRLRRPTFTCFAGRGAVAQLSRRGRDYQVNVLVGDRARASVAAEALDVARSFAVAP